MTVRTAKEIKLLKKALEENRTLFDGMSVEFSGRDNYRQQQLLLEALRDKIALMERNLHMESHVLKGMRLAAHHFSIKNKRAFKIDRVGGLCPTEHTGYCSSVSLHAWKPYLQYEEPLYVWMDGMEVGNLETLLTMDME